MNGGLFPTRFYAAWLLWIAGALSPSNHDNVEIRTFCFGYFCSGWYLDSCVLANLRWLESSSWIPWFIQGLNFLHLNLHHAIPGLREFAYNTILKINPKVEKEMICCGQVVLRWHNLFLQLLLHVCVWWAQIIRKCNSKVWPVLTPPAILLLGVTEREHGSLLGDWHGY